MRVSSLLITPIERAFLFIKEWIEKMTDHSWQHRLIGEVVSNTQKKISIVDLYSGQSYDIPSKGEAAVLLSGQVIQFVLIEDSPCQITLLATSGSAQAQLYKIVTDKKLTPFFSSAIQAEVEYILDNTGLDDPALEDQENLAFCTIDGSDTMDLDQALQVEKTSAGYTVRYAIADAAYFIRPGSALFEEALKRGTSYYLPGLMIPMLPRELCVDVISLNENVSRRAIVFEITLNNNGEYLKTRIVRAKIKSRGKLSFKEVETFFAGKSKSIRHDEELATSLGLFKEIGLLRLKLAEERNIARFHRTEVNIKLGQDGLVFNLLDNVRNEVELYNEQFSLLCNIAGAKLLADKGESFAKFVQPIYKVHPPPSNDKLKAFEAAIKQLIHVHQLEDKEWLWQHNGDLSLSDYLKKLPQTGAKNRVAQAIHRQALLTNTRSSFSEKPGRHFGVGADVYARFSAPMREIVGIFLHKELMEKIVGCDSICSDEQDEIFREQIILAANRAKSIQRQLTNEANLLVIDQVFNTEFENSKENTPLHKGTVIGLGRDKLYILLDDIPIEVKVYIRPLEGFWKASLKIDLDQLSLINSQNQDQIVSLGDEVEISVVSKDNTKHRWIFQLHNKEPLSLN